MEASRRFSESGRIRRSAETIAFVAVWVAAGELLGMSPNAYLLFGIPLTAGFQLLVRRRPIKELWVRHGPDLSLRTVSLKLAIPLAIVPLVSLVAGVAEREGFDFNLYALAAIVGAGAAAYALGRFRPETWRYLGLCLATADLLGVLLVIGPLMIAAWYDASTAQPTSGGLWPATLFGIESLLLYIPALFMMEEVAFRGAIDSHVHHPGERYGVASAIFVSVLWGLWHYPIIPHATLIQTVAQLLIVHVAVGPFLSTYWRKSGNLMVPAFVHAMIDSVRNALGHAP